MLKALFAILALSFSLNSFALTDDESLEFSDALTSGKLKVVQKYVKAEPAAVNDKIFGWSPMQMAANKGDIPTVSAKLFNEKLNANIANSAFNMFMLLFSF